jgi:hypothetical protein
MPASRFLAAAAVCVMFLSFAAESRESYWSGCIKVVLVICQQIFSILALAIFLLECLFTNVSKLFVFSPWRRDPVLELKFLLQLLVVLWCFTDLFQSM